MIQKEKNMQSYKKYISLILITAGMLTVPFSLEILNLRGQIFKPERIVAFVNDLLDRPEELGRYIHSKAVKKVIGLQEASSFDEVPKHFILLSFFDPDEWKHVIRYTIDRKQLSCDISDMAKLAMNGDEIILKTGSYLTHLKKNLPDFLEIFLNVLPRCNADRNAWFRSNSYVPLNKNMPKCLPCDPHRNRLKAGIISMAESKLAAAPAEINISERIEKSKGLKPEDLSAKISILKTTMALLWIFPLVLMTAGAFLAGNGNRTRITYLAAGVSTSGILAFIISLSFPLLPLPAAVFAGYTKYTLMIQAFLMSAAWPVLIFARKRRQRGNI